MWRFFVEHRKFSAVVALTIALLGFVSILQIPKESNPEVNIPIVVVTTPFPGANAVDVEQFVTNEIEDAVLSLDDVDEVTSTSSLGVSSVVVSFVIGVDPQDKRDLVQEAVDTASRQLPTDAEDPIVQRVSFNDMPIKVYALGGPYSIAQIKGFAEDIREDLERIPGVREATVIGGEDREVRVLVDPSKLDQYNLSLSQVVGAISRANSNVPVGTIQTAEQQYSVRFEGRLADPNQLADLPVSAAGDALVRVRDVATVVDGFKAKTGLSRLSTNGTTATPSVTINLIKADEGNILDVVNGADEAFAQAYETYLPEDVDVEVVNDSAQYIKDDLRNLSVSGLQTTLIVVFLILIILGWRESVLAGLAIPMTFFVTFMVLQFMGESLNFLTLFSLILSLGILVDGSIVMTEGLHANVAKGLSPKEAALQTIREFKAPLISGTLTTVFAFAPMLLTSGLIGEFIKSIPVTVSIVLFASLFVALAMIPTFGTQLLSETKARPTGRVRARLRDWWSNHSLRWRLERLKTQREIQVARLTSAYARVLDNHMRNKKVRRRFTWSLILGFIGSLALPIFGLLAVDMFPATDLDRVYVDIALPVATPLAVTEDTMSDVETVIQSFDYVESYLVTAGAGSPLRGGSGSHIGSAVLNLVERENREDSRDLLPEIEAALEPLMPLADVSVSQEAGGPDAALPVEVVIRGADLTVLEQLAVEFERLVADIPGTRDVGTSVKQTPGEFVLTVDRAAIARYNLSTFDVASELRTALFGATATTITTATDDLDVIVKYRFSQNDDQGTVNRVSADQLTAITIQTPQGDIPLNSFVDTNLEQSRSSIAHTDGDRVVSITSATAKNTPASVIFSQIRERMDEISVPDGYTVSLGGQDESTQESFNDLFKAMIIGVLLIAGLLILQFNSYRQPLFVLTSIPLSLIGVLPGLTLINQPLSFPGMIGIVALAGIVVNNGIILIDRINENRLNGMEKEVAVRTASLERLRPILLTTITTVAGLLPLVLTQPSWAPLGFAIIFGLVFSTVLTLLAVPLLYRGFGEDTLTN